MNRWTCDERGCTASAVGVAGAVGLRAIGWFFQRNPNTMATLFCPMHRPKVEAIQSRLHDGEDERNVGKVHACGVCAAEFDAARYQAGMISPQELKPTDFDTMFMSFLPVELP